MSEVLADTSEGPRAPLIQWLHRICVTSAAIGGLAIFGAAFFVTFSIVKSLLGFGALRGEFELVELACAVCASLFLPLCQLNKGHVMVDVFTSWMPHRMSSSIDAVWTLIFALGWAFLCWRILHGLWEIREFGDRTMLLRVSVWWIYVPAAFGTGLSSFVAFVQVISELLPRFARQVGV